MSWSDPSQEARAKYADAEGRHTAFEAEFKALCNRYQVQATVFYAGFDCVVSVSRVYSRQQLAAILHRALGLIPDMLDVISTVVSGRQGNTYVHYEDSE